MADITKAQQARAEKILNKVFRFSDYGVMTRKSWLEIKKEEGCTVEETDQPKVKYNRITYNRMDYREQAEYEAKMAERKPLYKLNKPNCPYNSFFEITKTEYDYFLVIETQSK